MDDPARYFYWEKVGSKLVKKRCTSSL